VDLSRISPATVMGKLLRAPLSLIPKAAVVPILTGPLRGTRWIVGSATHGCWLGTYEQAKQRLFARSIRPGAVVFDVGANVGFYTLIAARKSGPAGRVYAFEPLPRNIAFLRRHLQRNDVINAEVIEAAVSDAAGRAAFEESGSPAMGRLGSSGRLQVRTVTLDQMVLDSGLPPPEVIKIDIEGGETRALEGARRILARAQPLVFLATHGRQVHSQCCALLEEMGYRLAALNGAAAADTDELVARSERS
jgi:FkbM family methyltransferase